MGTTSSGLPSLPVHTRYRSGLLATTDAVSWALAIAAATAARYDLALGNADWVNVVVFAVLAAVAQALTGLATGLYRGKRRIGSFDEVTLLASNCASVILLLLFVTLAMPSRPLPVGAVLLGGVVALALMGGVRWGWRRWREARCRPDPQYARRLVVLGAGGAAERVLSSMLTDPESSYLPVALLDDDPGKANLRVRGVPVRGTRADLPEVLAATKADAVLVAIPRADRALLREIHAAATEADVQVLVLPPVSESLQRRADATDMRPLDETDLLGRQTVDTDLQQIADYLTGKRVLITGAGGSIGSELVRQVAQLGPERLVLCDRDESALSQLQLSLGRTVARDVPEPVLADIRDRDRVFEVFEAYRPHLVFHAAALKHVPVLQAHPQEAVKTNVNGTAHVLAAARTTGVERFVNVSTDKAADPVNVLGSTKRIAERLTTETALKTDGVFLSVRFGNVLGSRGSVLEVFRAQAEAGGPITVTHPEVTRYFMTVGEAVQLLIQAAVIGTDGEVLVLDMGEPVAIADLAAQIAAEHGDRIDIVYSGLRPGEKLHEQLFSRQEVGIARHHPLISHVAAPALEWLQVRATLAHTNGDLPDMLRELAAADIAQGTPVRELADHRDAALSSRATATPSSGRQDH